jgi:hypothetical protein
LGAADIAELTSVAELEDYAYEAKARLDQIARETRDGQPSRRRLHASRARRRCEPSSLRPCSLLGCGGGLAARTPWRCCWEKLAPRQENPDQDGRHDDDEPEHQDEVRICLSDR